MFLGRPDDSAARGSAARGPLPGAWKNLAKRGPEILRICPNKMKYFFPMLCVVAAGGAGYVFEPKITPNLITDIKTTERVTEIPVDGGGEKKPEKETALPKVDTTPTPPPVVKNDPVTPAPEPAPEPPPVVKNDPEPTPAPAPAPTPPPEAVPAPAPLTPPPAETPVAAGGALSPEQIEKVMQESLKAAKMEDIKFEDVTKWTAGSEETLDGVNYQTGEAAFKASTIFGTKTMYAKALIKDGKVARWVWKTSNLDLK